MFGRLLFLRLRSADLAIREGRLDDAHRIVSSPEVRAHKRGEALMGELAEKLIGRAREHFAEERFAEALRDLDKAEQAGVKLERVVELRGHVEAVAQEVERSSESQRQRIEQAKQRVAAGSLVGGRQLLAEAGDNVQAKELAVEIRRREERAEQGFAQVEEMIRQKQMAAAVERFGRVKPLHPSAERCRAVEGELCGHFVGEAMSALVSGRINRAREELDMLGELGMSDASRRDAEEMVRLAVEASRLFDEQDVDGARRALLRLQSLGSKLGRVGKFAWVKTAIAQLGNVDDLLTELHGGPLGEHAKRSMRGRPNRAARGKRVAGREKVLDETLPTRRRGGKASDLPAGLMLLVDGGGSYLLLRGERNGIGRAMTDRPAEIPIQADLSEKHAEIARVDEDYFVFTTREMEVDGKPSQHQLLRDGARVVLARNARFTFRLPHPQSASGVLEMSGSTKMPQDVRTVVLFSRTVMMGFGKHVHIKCNGASQDLVLFEREGGLWIRPQRSGGVDTEALPVRVGEQMEFFGVSFVIQPWDTSVQGPAFS